MTNYNTFNQTETTGVTHPKRFLAGFFIAFTFASISLIISTTLEKDKCNSTPATQTLTYLIYGWSLISMMKFLFRGENVGYEIFIFVYAFISLVLSVQTLSDRRFCNDSEFTPLIATISSANLLLVLLAMIRSVRLCLISRRRGY
jgi:hypothetical protein